MIFLYADHRQILECLEDEFERHFSVKTAEIVSLKLGDQKETHFFKRRICVDDSGWHIEMDQRYVRNMLDTMGMNQCKSGSNDQEIQATDDKLDPLEHREFWSGAGICQYMTEQRFDICFQYERNQEGCNRTNHSLKDKIEEDRTLHKRPSEANSTSLGLPSWTTSSM